MVHLHKGSYRYTHTHTQTQVSSVLCCCCCGMPHCRCPWRCFMTMCCTVASACLVVVAAAAELRSLLLLLHVLWPFSFLARKFVATCLEFRMRRCRLSCAQTKQTKREQRDCAQKKFTSVQRGVYLTCERGVYVCVCVLVLLAFDFHFLQLKFLHKANVINIYVA